MNKQYYFISYMYGASEKRPHNEVIDVHPLEWQRYANRIHPGQYVLKEWKKISKEEYDHMKENEYSGLHDHIASADHTAVIDPRGSEPLSPEETMRVFRQAYERAARAGVMGLPSRCTVDGCPNPAFVPLAQIQAVIFGPCKEHCDEYMAGELNETR